jgi:hypothetical protein
MRDNLLKVRSITVAAIEGYLFLLDEPCLRDDGDGDQGEDEEKAN